MEQSKLRQRLKRRNKGLVSIFWIETYRFQELICHSQTNKCFKEKRKLNATDRRDFVSENLLDILYCLYSLLLGLFPVLIVFYSAVRDATLIVIAPFDDIILYDTAQGDFDRFQKIDHAGMAFVHIVVPSPITWQLTVLRKIDSHDRGNVNGHYLSVLRKRDRRHVHCRLYDSLLIPSLLLRTVHSNVPRFLALVAHRLSLAIGSRMVPSAFWIGLGYVHPWEALLPWLERPLVSSSGISPGCFPLL